MLSLARDVFAEVPKTTICESLFLRKCPAVLYNVLIYSEFERVRDYQKYLAFCKDGIFALRPAPYKGEHCCKCVLGSVESSTMTSVHSLHSHLSIVHVPSS